MMKLEKDLMQGIDNKFYQLMSQFEQNMNILEKTKIKLPGTSEENIAIEKPAVQETPEIPVKSVNSNKLGSAKEKSEHSNPVNKKNNQSKKVRDNGVCKESAMGNVLRYVSDCADQQTKKKKKKKTISFSQAQGDSVDFVDQGSEDNSSNSVAAGSKRSGRRNKKHVDTLSYSSSKKRSNKGGEVVRKVSKTVTNTSKKGKRRQLKTQGPEKDWIAFNRTNLKKIKSANNKLQSSNTENNQKGRLYSDRLKKNLTKNAKLVEHKETEQKEPTHESIESKLISDFMQNEEKSMNKVKGSSEINNNNDRNRGIRTASAVRKVMVGGKENQKKDRPKLLHSRSLTSAVRDKVEIKYSNEYADREEDKEVAEIYKKERNKYRDVEKARSEMKMPSNYQLSNELDQDQHFEVDEFFREIPFVAGRSISRTFNLGLSFQYAMSMLKRIYNKKEVKQVLNIGCNDNPVSDFHCSGSGTCEAMIHSANWSKEDEEAWEENPWDPDLNRRRPKCTCLPSSCTTLKHVLKQLSIKNANFNTRSMIALPFTQAAQKLESEIDMLKRPKLKKALSQTRTELLRNIRTIQIQLSPATEI